MGLDQKPARREGSSEGTVHCQGRNDTEIHRSGLARQLDYLGSEEEDKSARKRSKVVECFFKPKTRVV